MLLKIINIYLLTLTILCSTLYYMQAKKPYNKGKSRMVSLRLSEETYKYLTADASKNVRSVSNYIEWLINEKKKKDLLNFENKLQEIRTIGEKVFVDLGMDVKQMSDQDVYDFIKKI